MADHADSLIHNVNNNVCEVANSITAKFISGKRIFYSRRTSFSTRCGAAALAMNTSGRFRQVLHKTLRNGLSPGKRLHGRAQRLLGLWPKLPTFQGQV
jgi:hypothetical protein